ncbi:MAG: LPS export ABC transporter permease LptF [Thermodesulfobacteriota bacterium]
MATASIVNRYIFFELIPPFVMNVVFFMFVFLMRQILEITNMIVNYQVSIIAFFLMLIYSMPYFLVYIIPMSVMMSTLLTFLRMSGDNEIVALKAAGVNMYRLLPAVLGFALMGLLITSLMAIYGMPWGRSSYEELTMKVVRSNFNVGLKAHHFNDSFAGVTFYVNDIDYKSRELHEVFIEDSRKSGVSSTVVAPKGYLFAGDDSYSFVLRLYNGLINQVQLDKRTAHAIRFDTYDIRLDLKSAVSDGKSRSKDEKEMGLSELIAALGKSKEKDKRYYSLLMELHRKFSIPFACIALSILAVPLGIQSLSARRSAGLGIGLICFLLYYLLLSAGTVFGETGAVPPLVGMWAPNFVMGTFGIYLFVKSKNDQPVAFFDVARAIGARVIRGLKKGRRPSC